MITNNLYLDVSRKEIKSITVSQGDKDSRTWNVYFSNNGTQLDLSSISSISVQMRKPDNTFIYNPCQIDIENNCAILTFDEQMTASNGIGSLQMSLYTYYEDTGNLEKLYTFAIKVIISSNSVPIDSITSSSEFKKLDELIIKAENTYEDVSIYADLARQSEENASESETKALESANNAKNSEINAKASETKALGYSNNAKTSETNAKTSENNTKTYATNAKSSETNAKTSETNAANSATTSKSWAVGGTGTRTGEDTDNSKYYATNAKTYASNASTSATNASTSENNAKTYASNAKASENNSKTYASNASTSATNAATSESNASNSALQARTSATDSQTYKNQAKEYSETWKGSLLPQGEIPFANIPVSGMVKGHMYCIINSFETDSRFEEGENFFYPAGTCIYWTKNNQWKCLSGVLSRNITQEEYDNLSEAQKLNGTIYYIEDGDNYLKPASATYDGLMSSEDKIKLDSVQTGAEVNQNAFSDVTVGTTIISADSKTDNLTLLGSNVTLTPDAANDKITIGITKNNVTSALGYTPYTPTEVDTKINDLESYVITNGGHYVGISSPSNTNLLWVDTGNNGILKYYDGETWVEIAGSTEILNSIQSYLTRAQALYDSMYIDCDGETPHLRVVTLIKIKGGTPQQRLIDGGISFNGGTPINRLLGI